MHMGWGESGGIGSSIMLGNKWGEFSASWHGPSTFLGGTPVVH